MQTLFEDDHILEWMHRTQSSNLVLFPKLWWSFALLFFFSFNFSNSIPFIYGDSKLLAFGLCNSKVVVFYSNLFIFFLSFTLLPRMKLFLLKEKKGKNTYVKITCSLHVQKSCVWQQEHFSEAKLHFSSLAKQAGKKSYFSRKGYWIIGSCQSLLPRDLLSWKLMVLGDQNSWLRWGLLLCIGAELPSWLSERAWYRRQTEQRSCNSYVTLCRSLNFSGLPAPQNEKCYSSVTLYLVSHAVQPYSKKLNTQRFLYSGSWYFSREGQLGRWVLGKNRQVNTKLVSDGAKHYAGNLTWQKKRKFWSRNAGMVYI